MKLEDIPDNFIHKFLPKRSSAETSQIILVCGLSCIGKTYFLTRIEQVTRGWKTGWRSINSTRKLNTENNVHHTRSAIMLGIPGSEYQKRLKERGKFQDKCTITALNTKLTLYYNEWIKALNSNQIPYIFVDARNDYPVLDRLSFFNLIK